MTTSRKTAEEIAQQFHEIYERLAPAFGYETRKESAKPWAEVPDKNKRLMIAVCDEIARTIGKEVWEAALKAAGEYLLEQQPYQITLIANELPNFANAITKLPMPEGL